MIALHRNILFWGAVVLWGGFFVWAPLLERQFLYEVENSIGAAVGVGVAWAWRSGIKDILSRPASSLDGSDLATVGIFIIGVGYAFAWTVMLYWRVTGKPDVVIDSLFNAFGRWILITGTILFLVAADAVKNRVPPRAYLKSGAWVAAGTAIALLTVSVSAR